MTRPNLILVEDDANLSLMLSHHLSRAGYALRTAGTMAAARELVRDEWDLAILDRVLPDGDGLDLCGELRGAVPHAYIIMLTGASSDDDKLDGFASGADDYVTKPARIEELLARVRAGLRIVTLQKQLLEQSQTDPLTSLRNRRAFDTRLVEELEHARRYDRPLSLAIIDVDRFKSVNDLHGHPTGDAVLRGVAKIIAGVTRQTDFVARIGGEEFAVLLPETSLFESLQFGEKIRTSIAAEPIAGLNVTISAGIANVPHSCVLDPRKIFEAADQALYRAKHNGRNRVEFERRRNLREAEHAKARPCEASA